MYLHLTVCYTHKNTNKCVYLAVGLISDREVEMNKSVY
jgi:hypothetical protein